MTAEHVPGLQIAVVADGRPLWSRGFGFADVDQRVPVEAQTVFRAASVSKPFTATLVMRQVEAGRIRLDDRVNDYLEPAGRLRDRDGNEAPVTIRQLLSHSSGLAVSWWPWASVRSYLLGRPQPTFEDNVSGGFRLAYPPGERIVYANPGYWLLGRLAARLTHEPFEEAVANEVLAPLGMTSSDFRPLPALTGRQAVRYAGTERTGRPVPGPHALSVNPAASLLTTAEDLTRFAEMVIGERGDARGAIAGARHRRRDAPPASPAGSGARDRLRARLRSRQHRGRAMIWHDGGDPGVSTRLAILPDQAVPSAVLMNASAAGAPRSVATRVLDALLGDVAPFDVARARREPAPPAWRRLPRYLPRRGFRTAGPGAARVLCTLPHRDMRRLLADARQLLPAARRSAGADRRKTTSTCCTETRWDGERIVLRDTEGSCRRVSRYHPPAPSCHLQLSPGVLVFRERRRRAMGPVHLGTTANPLGAAALNSRSLARVPPPVRARRFPIDACEEARSPAFA